MDTMILGIQPQSNLPVLSFEQQIAERVQPLLERLCVDYFCSYTNEPLFVPPTKGNWLTYLTPAAQRHILKNNEQINKWLIKYQFVDTPLPPVPCHRSRTLLKDAVVPGSARINPGERHLVVGLWKKYAELFQLACQDLPKADLGLLLRKLVGLENLYMSNYLQVSEAIEIITLALNTVAPPRSARPSQVCETEPILLLPALSQSSLMREALRVAHLLQQIHDSSD